MRGGGGERAFAKDTCGLASPLRHALRIHTPLRMPCAVRVRGARLRVSTSEGSRLRLLRALFAHLAPSSAMACAQQSACVTGAASAAAAPHAKASAGRLAPAPKAGNATHLRRSAAFADVAPLAAGCVASPPLRAAGRRAACAARSHRPMFLFVAEGRALAVRATRPLPCGAHPRARLGAIMGARARALAARCGLGWPHGMALARVAPEPRLTRAPERA